MAIAGSAVLMATDKLLAEACKIAAHLLEVASVERRVTDGLCAFVSSDGRQISWQELARATTYPRTLPVGMEPVLHETR